VEPEFERKSTNGRCRKRNGFYIAHIAFGTSVARMTDDSGKMGNHDMKMLAFDHVNVKTANLENMVRWYEEVLGLKPGPRPAFPFPGAWIYLGDRAIIHLVGVENEPKSDDPKIEHFAISASGMAEFLAHIESQGVKTEVFAVPGFNITQVNIFDPDGNHIHIDFRTDD